MHSSLGRELNAGSPTAHTHLRETSALQWPAAKAERGQRQGHFPDPGQGRRGHSLEVVTCRFQEGSGLIGHRPHHDSWVILVPAHQLLHHLKVVLQRLVVVALAMGGRKGSVSSPARVSGWATWAVGTHLSTMPTPGLSSMTTIPYWSQSCITSSA